MGPRAAANPVCVMYNNPGSLSPIYSLSAHQKREHHKVRIQNTLPFGWEWLNGKNALHFYRHPEFILLL